MTNDEQIKEMLKLEVIKNYEPDNIDSLRSCVVLNDETAVILIIDKQENYSLLVVNPDEIRSLPLNYLETFLNTDNNPVLFTKDGGFGIIRNQNELFYYQNIDSNPEKIEIENGQIFPPKTRLRYPNPISNSDVIPICFQHSFFEGNSSRYFAFLNLNIEKRKAKWERWASLEKKHFPYLFKGALDEPPVINNIMLINNDVYIFTSGDRAFVNKWGMRNYGIFKITKQGEIIETLLDSGNLDIIDQKKRGVYGVFSSSQKYAILTPVFQSDEWKGKQKLFSIESKELIDINFPRGFGKYPQIVQHSGKYFWVYLRDTKHIIICK